MYLETNWEIAQFQVRSGFGSPASEVSLEESDVPIIVWDTRKGSNSERIGSRNRTVYLETNWEIAQFRVSPAPDQSPASEVRLRNPASEIQFP